MNTASDPDNQHLTDSQLSQAERHGAEMLATEPRARTVRFDAGSGRIVVDLSNGCSFAFPVHLAQGLEGARPIKKERSGACLAIQKEILHFI